MKGKRHACPIAGCEETFLKRHSMQEHLWRKHRREREREVRLQHVEKRKRPEARDRTPDQQRKRARKTQENSSVRPRTSSPVQEVMSTPPDFSPLHTPEYALQLLCPDSFHLDGPVPGVGSSEAMMDLLGMDSTDHTSFITVRDAAEEPATEEEEPVLAEEEPATGEGPATEEQEPALAEEKPATEEQEPEREPVFRPIPYSRGNQRQPVDPRLLFVDAPCLRNNTPVAESLRGFRRQARMRGTTITFREQPGAVTRIERAILPDGTIYVLESRWQPDPAPPRSFRAMSTQTK